MVFTRLSAALTVVGIALSAVPGAAAQEHGTFTFVLENDWMFDQDRDYSNGVRLDYVSGERTPGDGWTGRIARRLLGARSGSVVRTGIALNHMMFEPEDTSGPGVPRGQHPYAGYIGGEYSVFERRESALEQLSFELGIIGPEARAEYLHDTFHELFPSPRARGWDSQLDTEPAVAVSYDRAQKVFFEEGPVGLAADIIVHGGGTVGTTLVQANGGGAMRIGTDLGDDFLPVRMFPYSGAGFWDNDSLASAYLFVGFEGRAVVHNVYLDGANFSVSPRVEKETWVGDFFVGAAAQLWILQASFTLQERGRTYATEDLPRKVGSMSVSVSF